MSQQNFYVTTPIYYVNDKPHIGHAYTTILADVLAQYHRLKGEPTFFLTGTDEHGMKVQQAAEAAGITPQEQADRTVVRFQELWEKLEVTNDDFIRTTEERHKKVVQASLQDLYDRGEIYKASYDGWYDVGSETFITEGDLAERGGPDANPRVVRVSEENYFFRMSAYQEWLVGYIEEHPEFIQPSFRRNETLGFLRKPLQDLCISRPKSRLAWGIDLPFDKDYVTYVWFDALVNYVSAIGYSSDEQQFEQWWPANFQLIGKDILTTHTVYWPTMLKAMGLPMPQTIFAHGWWLYDGSKMAKSMGNVVNPMDMVDRYGVDATRYFLIAEMTVGQDASFSEASFVRRYNSDLANDLGNLLSRVLNMVQRYCDSVLPAPSEKVLDQAEEAEVWASIQEAVKAMFGGVDAMRLDLGAAGVMAGVRAVNTYLERRKPWTLAKSEEKQPLYDVLYTAAECLRVVSGLLHPVMPERMNTLRQSLGLPGGKPNLHELASWGSLPPGSRVEKSAPLFPRIQEEDPDMEEEKNPAPQPGEPPPAAKPKEDEEGAGLVTFEAFSKIQLKTAVVIEAERIEGTTKLLKLQVRMGQEHRQLVAGIALHYTPEELIGRTVVVVANLKPARIRGVDSQGMVLAASVGETLRLVTVEGDLTSGAEIR